MVSGDRLSLSSFSSIFILSSRYYLNGFTFRIGQTVTPSIFSTSLKPFFVLSFSYSLSNISFFASSSTLVRRFFLLSSLITSVSSVLLSSSLNFSSFSLIFDQLSSTDTCFFFGTSTTLEASNYSLIVTVFPFVVLWVRLTCEALFPTGPF